MLLVPTLVLSPCHALTLKRVDIPWSNKSINVLLCTPRQPQFICAHTYHVKQENIDPYFFSLVTPTLTWILPLFPTALFFQISVFDIIRRYNNDAELDLFPPGQLASIIWLVLRPKRNAPQKGIVKFTWWGAALSWISPSKTRKGVKKIYGKNLIQKIYSSMNTDTIDTKREVGGRVRRERDPGTW